MPNFQPYLSSSSAKNPLFHVSVDDDDPALRVRRCVFRSQNWFQEDGTLPTGLRGAGEREKYLAATLKARSLRFDYVFTARSTSRFTQ